MAKKQKKTNDYKFTKTRIVIFLILCVVLAVTLPFSAFFEEKIDAYLTKDIGEYATAIESDLVVHVIDVGSADCIAIELPDGKKMLIDAGVDMYVDKDKYSSQAIEYIKQTIFDGAENGIFDYFILTHQDADHCNNAVPIFDAFQFKTVYRPSMFYNKEKEPTAQQSAMIEKEIQRAKDEGYIASSVTSFDEVKDTLGFSSTNIYFNFLTSIYNETYEDAGETKNCEVKYNFTGSETNTNEISNLELGYSIKFYSPNELKYSSANNYSPVIFLSYKDKDICLTGDAEKEVEKYLVDNYNLPQVDVLKVGHHGSETSSTLDFLNEISPTYAFISVGPKDRHENPDAGTLERLKNSGIIDGNILTTKDNGALIFAVDVDDVSGEASMLISASGGAIVVNIEWWYICVTILIVGAGLIFGIGSGKKKTRK